MDFKGRKVLVTGVGAANGIGFAAAQLFHNQGATVFMTSLSGRCLERMAEIGGDRVFAQSADLTDGSSAQKLVELAAVQMGGIDVLVNNAGMTSVLSQMGSNGESNSAGEITPQAWTSAINRNLDSVFLVSKFALPYLRKSGSGRIVNVSSVTGAVMVMRNDAAYAAAKAGVIGLTRSLALDEAANGVTANAVSPGWIETDSQTDDEVNQGKRTPIGRSGTAAEVATTILWLASEAASYVTGQNLVVDGGNSIAEERF
jgi:3-oxoacyl-[acyl-carrier protein] reductase